jgi:hypothetical protein
VGLSESEIEVRLAALRRRREALDREIADLVLYLELGRRLGASAPAAGQSPVSLPDPGAEGGTDRVPAARRAPATRFGAASDVAPAGTRTPAPVPGTGSGLGSVPHRPAASGAPARPEPAPTLPDADGAIPPAIAFTEDASGARRYGRALVQAAWAAIARAGRPLHAAEILEALLAQGFTLPGRDPVAALNTRLWKRAGPGGPLSRVGEATYALASPDPRAA